MTTITPMEALDGKKYAIIDENRHVYSLYRESEEAMRICQRLQERSRGAEQYIVAAIDFGGAA